MSRLNLSALFVFVGIASSLLVGSSNQAVGQTVVINTNLGDIQVELNSTAAPITVANFLAYVNAPAGSNYDGTFFHRSINGFIVQGGGFYTSVNNALPLPVPQMPPILNEPGISNTPGTIAMAKLGGDPDSATNQWFFNTADNSANLDFQNGGFTVFGTVTSGMDVVDAIEAAPVFDLDGFGSTLFDAVPLIIINDSADFVIVNSVRVVVPGDVNLDGAIDFLDIAPFISVLSIADFQAEADINLDTNVDFLDISPFIGLLSSQ